MFGADAIVAAQADDAKRVTDDLLAQVQLATIVAKDARGNIESLVAKAITAYAARTTRCILTEFPVLLTAAQLDALDNAFGSMPERLSHLDVATARLTADDLLQRVYTDDGAGDGRITMAGAAYATVGVAIASGKKSPSLPLTFLALSVPSRRETKQESDRYLDALIAELEKPLTQQDFASATSSIDAFPAAIVEVTPSVAQSCSLMRPVLLAARVAIAVSRHRALHGGAEPMSIESIDGAAAGMPLVDPFDGKPLRSLLRDGRLVIYSIGFDGDDDGALCLRFDTRSTLVDENPMQPAGGAIPDCDWVLFGPLR
ncbi:MAG: hypothetical protein SGJ09_05290 [Phycisphaerae bacterium]|nr:hypothetical protein [Phycisphaerae bacterium]